MCAAQNDVVIDVETQQSLLVAGDRLAAVKDRSPNRRMGVLGQQFGIRLHDGIHLLRSWGTESRRNGAENPSDADVLGDQDDIRIKKERAGYPNVCLRVVQCAKDRGIQKRLGGVLR